MAKKTMLDNRIYNDAWFFALPSEAKWLFVFLLTNDACNLIGCYEIPLPVISTYTGLPASKITAYLATFKDKIIYTEGFIIIRNYARYNPMRNPSLEVAKQGQEAALPDKIRESYDNFTECVQGVDTLSQGVDTPIGTVTVKEKEKVIVTESKKNEFSTYESLDDNALNQIAQKYNVPIRFVQSCHEDMGNWLKSKGKKYKDYYAALCNWVKRDAINFAERRVQGNVRPAIDATGLSRKQ